MKRQLLVSAALFLLLLWPLAGAEIRREFLTLIVTVQDADSEQSGPRVRIEGRSTDAGCCRIRNQELQLDAAIESVADVRYIGPDRVIIRGNLRGLGRDDVLSVISAASGEIVDRVWVRDLAFSPDGRTAVYLYRSPNSIGQVQIRTSLLAYDLTAAPGLNRIPGWKSDSPSEKGIVLYPDDNRVAGRYWTALQPEAVTVKDRSQFSFASPIAWSADSRRIAVVEQEGEECRLVVVDVSRSIWQPVAAAIPISREQFLGVRGLTDYPGARPSFKAIRFSADGRGVELTSWGMGPFEERTISLTLPERK